jgi:TldD protein
MLDRKIIEEILFESLNLGGDFAEIFLEDKTTRHYQMISGKLEKSIEGKDFGIGIRVYFGHRSIYTYTSNLDRENILAMLKAAILKPGSSSVDPKPLGHSAGYLNTENRKGSAQEKVLLMKNASEAAMNYSEKIKQVIVNYVDNHQRVMIANTEGLFTEDQRLRTRLSISSTAEYATGMQTGSTNAGGHQDFDFYKDVDIDHLAQEASRIALTMAQAGYAPSGLMPVVIGNGFGGVLFHEASGHGLEATSVAKGLSVYAGKMGQQVASPLVTAIDDGTIPNAWGSQKLDDEGHVTQKNILIEKGILKSYLVDRLNGKIMDTPVTGSARRQSYKYAPSSRMTNTYIDAGDSNFDEIIRATDQGLYAKYLGGGSVNPATGEFNFAVMEGYLIENGKIGKPVRGATLIGTGFDVLKNIDMVGNDLSYGHGMCGSVSGSIPVNVGQPSLRVKEITVGGRSE